MAFDSKKFLVRTGSAAVFVVVLLGCILWNYYSFSALFFVVSLWGLHEFYKLMELNGGKPQKWIGFMVGAFTYLVVFSVNFVESLSSQDLFRLTGIIRKVGGVLFVLGLLLSMIAPIIELFRNKEKPFENLSITFFGIAYCVAPFAFLNTYAINTVHSTEFVYKFLYQPQLVIALFLLIWSNDTFAYLVGSFIGKNKMYERISPGKTWEGTIGGALLTIASSFLIYKWFGILELHDWIIISAIVAVFGTLGDLVESMLKRSVGVKDSGNIMPGHGGILDRFDSLIMVAPFVFLYLILK